MKATPFFLALSLLAPAAVARASGELSRAEKIELCSRFDPGLGSLRAGAFAVPAPLADDELAVLRAVSREQGGELASLRAGVTSEEWTLILVGAVVVLLIILIA
jgi:hypothetical protein